MGYSGKEQCIQFLRTPNEKKNWDDVKIIIFDAPQAADKPYSQRLELLKQST
jgi:hypothetical protein